MVTRHGSGPLHRLPAMAAAAVTAVLTLSAMGPAPTVGKADAAVHRPRDGGAAARRVDWAARPISAGGIRVRDRDQLRGLPPQARLGYHPATGRVRFISGSPRRPLAKAPAAVLAGARPFRPAEARSRARRFVDRYGGLFGLASARREMRAQPARRHSLPLPTRLSSASGARSAPAAPSPFSVTVRFDQVRAGLPVMGGQIAVQVSDRGEVISAAGEVLPSVAKVATRPRLSAGVAASIAATWLARQAGRTASVVSTRSEGLAIYDPRLMGDDVSGPTAARLVWQIDARMPPSDRQEAREQLVVVDARGGQVLTSIGRLYRVGRFVCDNRNLPGRPLRCDPPFARREGQSVTGVADVDAAYRLMGSLDAYLAERFGRTGLDGQGAGLKATVRYCAAYGCPWRNAEWKWREQQAVFGIRVGTRRRHRGP